MSEDTTPKDFDDYELRDEYDLSVLPVMPWGRYDPSHRRANLVVLDPDIAKAFPDDASVNEALRLVLQMVKLPQLADAGA